MRDAVEQAEEYRFRCNVEPRELGSTQPTQPKLPRITNEHVEVRQRQKSTCRATYGGSKPGRVPALNVTAIERIS